jgi:hypothetical protein
MQGKKRYELWMPGIAWLLAKKAQGHASRRLLVLFVGISTSLLRIAGSLAVSVWTVYVLYSLVVFRWDIPAENISSEAVAGVSAAVLAMSASSISRIH